MTAQGEKVQKLKSKTYRHAYMQGHVRAGIAYQLRALREQRGMSQAAFAKLVGKPQSVISRLESTEYGKVSVQTLIDIAVAVDVALNVRFCSYPAFLASTVNVSTEALQVPSFEDSSWHEVSEADRPVAVAPNDTVPGIVNTPTTFHPIAFAENGTGVGIWLMLSINSPQTLPAQDRIGTRISMQIPVKSESVLST